MTVIDKNDDQEEGSEEEAEEDPVSHEGRRSGGSHSDDNDSHATSFEDNQDWRDGKDTKTVNHIFKDTDVSDDSQVFNGDAGSHSILTSRKHEVKRAKITRSSLVNGNIGVEEYLIAIGHRKRSK